MATFKFRNYYGQITKAQDSYVGKIPEDFTFNTLIGIVADHLGNVWVCDTGNNRLIIFDEDLKNIIQIIAGIGEKNENPSFLLPFHIKPHPTKNQMYLTDMGRHRIVVFEYDASKKNYASFVFAFGQKNDGINKSEKFLPLRDPNGLTFIQESNEEYVLYVTDEFFYTTDDNRNRCVKFSDEGEYLGEFRSIYEVKNKRSRDLK